MLYKIGDKIVEITKTDELRGWNRVGAPDITRVPNLNEYLTSVEVPISKQTFDSIVELIDKTYYHLTSQNEITEFIYRFASHVARVNMDFIAKPFS